jgi:hypothetical protein
MYVNTACSRSKVLMYVVEHTRIEVEKAPARGDDRGFSERVSVITIYDSDSDAANPHTSYPVAGESTSSHARPYMLPPQRKQQVGHRPDHSNTRRYSACRDTGG